LPFPDLNWTGRLINKDGSSKEINLVPDKVSNENINLLLSINGQGKWLGVPGFKKQITRHLILESKNHHCKVKDILRN
jgi:hypothetical protein